MKKPNVLLVDDENYGLKLLVDILSSDDYQLTFAKNGRRALELVAKNPPDLILLDIIMPEIDGWEVLKTLKQNRQTRDIPIIVQTGLQSAENFKRGLAEGAYYFISKPLEPERVRPLVRAALDEYRRLLHLKSELKNLDNAISLTKEWKIRFRTLEEALAISKLLAKGCPDPNRVITGLMELLINAVEHGIAKISYQEKTDLLYEQSWETELTQRLNAPENLHKYANVTLHRSGNQIEIKVEDPGDGFDFENYLDFAIERATDSHGRGIAMAKALSFDKLEYSGNGNVVTGTLLTD